MKKDSKMKKIEDLARHNILITRMLQALINKQMSGVVTLKAMEEIKEMSNKAVKNFKKIDRIKIGDTDS